MSDSRNDKYINDFCRNLKSIRLKKGLSSNTVGDKSKMGVFSYSRIENGRVNISICTLKALADALDVHPSKLLDF